MKDEIYIQLKHPCIEYALPHFVFTDYCEWKAN